MKALLQKTLTEWNQLLTANTPTPGGGSASAFTGAQGAALCCMVAELTYGKKAWSALAQSEQEAFQKAHEELKLLVSKLEAQVQMDTDAFDAFMKAMKLPKETEVEIAARQIAMNVASKLILDVPMLTAEQCLRVLQNAQIIAANGNKNALSDIGTGAALAFAALEGSLLNVQINLSGVQDPIEKDAIYRRAETMREEGAGLKEDLLAIVLMRM